ncbi:PDZ and LIM domain protein 2 isoform X2 [Hyperolius riggenbachi]|uniref:PDZ and LIM domain protein 2 isoform X2 n=1 Tax=Hyperolius riggenbachi TaxID=752182 RepID=UPI0035A2CED8
MTDDSSCHHLSQSAPAHCKAEVFSTACRCYLCMKGISTSFPSKLSPVAQKPVASSTLQKPILNTVPSPQRVCEKCNSGISDMAVRISEGRYRHPVCYVCTDCGLNLRMRGHFWAGNDLVCEKHARARHTSQNGNNRT